MRSRSSCNVQATSTYPSGSGNQVVPVTLPLDVHQASHSIAAGKTYGVGSAVEATRATAGAVTCTTLATAGALATGTGGRTCALNLDAAGTAATGM
jgi:hypothetical protein